MTRPTAEQLEDAERRLSGMGLNLDEPAVMAKTAEAVFHAGVVLRHELDAVTAELAGVRASRLPDDELRDELQATREDLTEARAAIQALRDAAQAIGVFPETYCWCGDRFNHLAPDDRHTGECKEVRAALALPAVKAAMEAQ